MKHLSVLCVLWLLSGIVSADVRIIDAWIPAAPPTLSVFAGYMTIENTGPYDVRVSGIRSPRFDLIEMHQTVIKDGMASMNKQEFLEIPANGVLKLEPQGRHLMLLQPQTPVHLGEEIPFTAAMDDGRTTTFNAVVKTPTLP